jgi:hypothetical protein
VSAPVSSRVSDPAVDRILRNHDERIRELQKHAQDAGRAWKAVSAWALLPTNQAAVYTKTGSSFIAGGSISALLPIETVAGERLVAVHALVNATGVGTMSLRAFRNEPAALTQIGNRVFSAVTGDELLSTTGLNMRMERGSFVPHTAIVTMVSGDVAYTLAWETERV